MDRKTIKPKDVELIAGFLEDYHHEFQGFLDDQMIEPADAEVIIEKLAALTAGVDLQDDDFYYEIRVIGRRKKEASNGTLQMCFP